MTEISDKIKAIGALDLTAGEKLIAITMALCKTSDTVTLCELTGENRRAVQRARTAYLDLCDKSDSRDKSDTSVATDATDATPVSPLAPASHARIETPSGLLSQEDKIPPNPPSGGSPQNADELARKAYEAGLRTKGGATAKSGRAVQRTKGELDGSQGVLFDDGKLTLLNGTAAAMAAEFPGINLEAVANKAAPDIAKLGYPSRADALAVFRKHAQWDRERQARPAPAKPVSAAESRLERGRSFLAKLSPKPEAVQ